MRARRGRNILADDALGEQNGTEEIRAASRQKIQYGNRSQTPNWRSARVFAAIGAVESEANARSSARDEYALRYDRWPTSAAGANVAAPRRTSGWLRTQRGPRDQIWEICERQARKHRRAYIQRAGKLEPKQTIRSHTKYAKNTNCASPTLRRCRRFSKRWACGPVFVTKNFARHSACREWRNSS